MKNSHTPYWRYQSWTRNGWSLSSTGGTSEWFWAAYTRPNYNLHRKIFFNRFGRWSSSTSSNTVNALEKARAHVAQRHAAKEAADEEQRKLCMFYQTWYWHQWYCLLGLRLLQEAPCAEAGRANKEPSEEYGKLRSCNVLTCLILTSVYWLPDRDSSPLSQGSMEEDEENGCGVQRDSVIPLRQSWKRGLVVGEDEIQISKAKEVKSNSVQSCQKRRKRM